MSEDINVRVRRVGPRWHVTCNGQVLGTAVRRRSALRTAESVSLILERFVNIRPTKNEATDG